MTNEKFWETVVETIESEKARSAWSKGIKAYAVDMVADIRERAEYEKMPESDIDETVLIDYALNGADNWRQYSWGGCSLIYDGDICDLLCTPSEKKRFRGGELHPSGEEWLDVQARALYQAYRHVLRAVDAVRKAMYEL